MRHQISHSRAPHWVAVVLVLGLCGVGCTVKFTDPGDDTDAVAQGCGNGILEPGEACDGTDFGGQTCDSVAGYSMGSLACTGSCGLELSGCHDCGNGQVDPDESCDDLNGDAGDGCLGCQVEAGWTCIDEPSQCSTICGDGLILGVEECDDGNLDSGDGCSGGCQGEPGWVCSGEPSQCAETCGNGVQDPGEACDDGNLSYDDGCSPSCVVESGWDCSGWPSTCNPVCGDAIVLPGEPCDDGNAATGDGCDNCAVEAGWTCDYSGNPPQGCVPICGDGLLLGGEACDDGNSWSWDGCSATCEVQDFYACDGEPSLCHCVVYVDRDPVSDPRTGGSWSAALDDLGSALGVSYNRRPCEIWVAEGTYYTYQSNPNDQLTLYDDSELYGGFIGGESRRDQRDFLAHPTVISGEQDGLPSNQVYSIFYASSDQGIVIDGFTITRASSTFSRGGGLQLHNSSQALVQNVRFEDNAAEDGGALYVEGGSSVQLVDATFLSNTAQQDGGAIYGTSWGLISLERCFFQGNQAGQDGGAIYADGPDMTVSNSRFHGNLAQDYGGALGVSSNNFTMTSSVLWLNDAPQGGGGLALWQLGSPADVINCTFYDNTAGAFDGASIRVSDGNVDVLNCILWGPTTDQVDAGMGGDADVDYSNIYGYFSGSGNIDQNPLFVDPVGGDFRLAPGSPCIDRAEGWNAPATDIDGLGRVDDPGAPNFGQGTPDYVDMGAHERQLP